MIKQVEVNYSKNGIFYNNNIRFINLFTLFIFIACSLTYAQSEKYKFDEITIEDGLSQSTVFSIIQDKMGYLWFGTQDGLNRYDGRIIKVYSSDSNDSTAISDTWISKIVEDHDGYIWIGTQSGGLNRYDPVRETFVHFKKNGNGYGAIDDNTISDIYIDFKDRMWVCTNAGLNLYDKQSENFTKIPFAEAYKNNQASVNLVYADRDNNLWAGTTYGIARIDTVAKQIDYDLDSHPAFFNLLNFTITSLEEDNDGNLWIGTAASGVFKYNLTNHSLIQIKYKTSDILSLSSNSVIKIFSDRDNKVWVATDDGLNVYDSERNSLTILRSDPSDNTSLSNSQVLDIYQDKSGIIWIGCFAGAVNKCDMKSRVFEHYQRDPSEKNTLVHNNIWSFTKDSKGIVWIGTNKGFSRFNPRTNKFTNFRHNPDDKNSLTFDVVRIIFADRNDRIWLGTDGGGLDMYNPAKGDFTHYHHAENNPNSISSEQIRAISENEQGLIWVGTWDGLDLLNPKNGRITHFRNDVKEGTAIGDKSRFLDQTQDKVIYVDDAEEISAVSDNRIRSLYYSRNNKLWVGTYGGLNAFDPQTEKFKSFQHDQNRNESLSNNRVLCILEDRRGILWIGTFDGLNRFNPETFSFKSFNKSDGLPNEVIYGILEDDEGFIWISTNRGICRFDPRLESPEFHSFNMLDGLQSNEFNGGAYLKTDNGVLYFGGINGFNKFNPADVKENEVIPNIVITDFKIFDKSVKGLGNLNNLSQLSLTYKDRYVSFEFAALDFSNPKKNQYAYKLDGLDDEWIECGNRSSATYTNLNGGQYTFLVRGSNNDGIWNPNPAKLSIYVKPPIWGYLWVQITLALLAVLIGVVLYRRKMSRVRERRFRLETKVNQRTMELKATNENLTVSQQESKRMLTLAVSINEIGQKISSELDLDALLNEVVASVQKKFGYYNVLILMAVEDGSGLQLKAIAGGYANVYPKELYVPMGEGFVGQAAFSQNTQLSNDVSKNKNYKCKYKDINTKSELSVPIVIGSELFGVLDIQNDKADSFKDVDVNALETFSTQIASSINNARLFTKNEQELKERRKVEDALRKSRDTLLKSQRETHRRVTQASLLYEVGQKISSELDMNKLLTDIVQNARDSFDYFGVMLLLYDKEKNGVVLNSIAGGYEDIFPQNLFLKSGEGMIGAAVETRETQICNDVKECDFYVAKADEVTRSELSVPVMQGDELIGVLDIQSDKEDSFDDVDVSTLETFSTQIAGAITNARLYVIAQDELKEREKAEQQVRESLERLEMAKRETDNIFQNVEEGIFLLNLDMTISGQYSKSLERVLSSTNLGNQSFVRLLESKIPDSLFKSAKEYLHLMFKEDLDEEMISDLNPISDIELSFVNEKEGSTDIKYLSFKFKRIYNSKKKITELLSTVRDITSEKSLVRKLEDAESQQKKQMEWMLSVLHVEAPLLQEFIKGVKDELLVIDEALKNSKKNVDFGLLLEKVYRSMHIIKGNAGLLDLKFVTQKAHDFEEQIDLIKENDNISGSSFVPLILRLGDIRSTITELEGLAQRISKIHTNFRPKRSYESDVFKQSLTNMISNVARDVDKKVEFNVKDFDPNAIPFQYRLAVKEILIQLIRNSVYHGIEPKEERKKVNKTALGQVKLSSFVMDNNFGIKFRDDGRGLQLEKLKEKAINSGNWSADEVNTWDQSKVVQLIFEHGISTADSKNLTAGRGVGMDVIKEKIKKMEGTVDIHFEEGKYTEFVIVLPSNRKRY